MAAKRLSPLILTVVSICAAVAAWLSGGALTVVSAQPFAPRIGILPSPMWLALSVLIAFTGHAVWRSGFHRLGLLALTGILFAPWMPFPVPAAAYVWTGPLRMWLLALVTAALAAPVLAARLPLALGRAVSDPRRAPVLAAVAAAAVYLVAANRVLPQLPAGDEPHYLVITQSLLADHDLKIENNHRRGDYHAYYPVDLKPDYRRRGADDEIYSIHAPGLAVIVAPAFALFGYLGVLAFLAVVSGLATALAWTAAWRVTSNIKASWFGWATIALTAPFCFQSFVAYPDALGGALIMVGVLALTDDETTSTARLALTGLALAILPWLHTRYAIAAVSLGILILVRQFQKRNPLPRAAAFLTLPVTSAVCWFGFFYAIYGTPDPRAPYGGLTQSALANLPHGVVGLLFDQQFGLLPAAPVYLCALAGLVVLARRLPRLAVELLVLALPYGLVVAGYEMWWGGVSSPARFLVPVLLPLAIPASVWFESRSGRASRLLGLGALAVSVLITLSLACTDRGALLYNSRDGVSRLLLWLSPLVNITLGMPSVFRTGPAVALAHAAVWLGAIAVTAAVGVLVERRGAATTGVALALGFAAALAGSAALSTVWLGQPTFPVTVTTGTLAFLRRYDPDASQMAVRSAPLRLLRPRSILSALTLGDVAPAALAHDAPAALLFQVPAGTYAVEATSSGDMSGQLSATLDRAFGSQWQWNLGQWNLGGSAQRAWRQEIILPISVPALLVNADAAARRSLDRIVLRPVSIVGSRHQLAVGEPRHVARYGHALVFFMGGAAYMEQAGTWVEGGGSANFVISPDTGPYPIAPGVQVLVRNSSVANTVTLAGDGWRQELPLEAGEERIVTLPAGVDRPATWLRVTAASGARPVDFEKGSVDARRLGAWIETR